MGACTDVFSNRFAVIPDACVLADVAKRDLILTLAEAGLFRLRWSDRILNETEGAIRNILKDREDAAERAAISVGAMRRAFPEAMNNEHARILDGLDCLPDEKDHHVLASDNVQSFDDCDGKFERLPVWGAEAVLH